DIYLGNQYYNVSKIPAAKIKRVVQIAVAKASTGSDMQRLVGLALLLIASPDDAAAVAAKTVSDDNASQAARVDALQIQLLSLPRANALEAAVAALGMPDTSFRKVAVPYLAS